MSSSPPARQEPVKLFASYYFPVLRIRDILVRIRIRGSVFLTNKSVRLFVIDLQDANKRLFFSLFFRFLLLKVHLHHFSKIKSHKEVTKQ
jgi:hypothetical protein